jgi:hypothetical protein
MGTNGKLIQKILSGASDANISFMDICNLLIKLGFKMKSGAVITSFGKKA